MGRPVRIIEVHGMKASEVVKAVRLVEIWKQELLTSWEEIHGE